MNTVPLGPARSLHSASASRGAEFFFRTRVGRGKGSGRLAQMRKSRAMIEYLETLQPVLMVLLGWALGLLTPAIAERIHRGYRRKDLMQAVVDELRGLQYTMAFVAYLIRSRNADVPDSFLDLVIPILENHQGPDRDERAIEHLRNLRKVSVQQRAVVHQSLQKPNRGLWLQQYALPLVGTQIADLAICPVAFQRSVLRIHQSLDLFNQQVPLLQSAFDRTFDNLSDENQTALRNNLEQGYQNLARRAETIIKAITTLQQEFAPH